MSTPHEAFDTVYVDLLETIGHDPDYTSDTVKLQIDALVNLNKARPEPVAPVVDPDPVPETRWGRFKCGLARAWDNETTRTLIKAGGSVGGVAIVAYSTIKKDHVLERQAIDQAHQPQIR